MHVTTSTQGELTRKASIALNGIVLAVLLAACTATSSESAGNVDAIPASTTDPTATTVVAPSDPASTSTTPTAPTTTVTIPVTTTTLAPPPAPLTMLFTGDLLMHTPLWSQARRNAEASGLADRVRNDPSLDTDGVASTPPLDFTPMFAHIAPLIADTDLAICHMETPIAPPGEEYSTHPRYGVPAEVVDSIAAAGFEHCSTSSNHTFDRGMPAFNATIDRFDAIGVTQHGMARTPDDRLAHLIDVDGTTVGHLSYSYGWDLGQRPADEPWRSSLIDADLIISDAQDARDRGADMVVLSLHWGNSGSTNASTSQRELAEQLAATGLVDLIVGHHAHVVQPIERVGDMWVAYGLGNLISNLPTPDSIWGPATQDGILVHVTVDRTADRPTITDVAAIPIWVDRGAGWIVRDVLTALDDPELTRIHRELGESLRRTSRVLADWIPVVEEPADSDQE